MSAFIPLRTSPLFRSQKILRQASRRAPRRPLAMQTGGATRKRPAAEAAAARDALLHAKGYRPGDNVVIFDGVCAMCNSGVDFVMKNDTSRQFKFAALQSETGKALSEKFDCPTDLSTMVYVEGDKAYVRSDAMLKIGRRLGWFMALPSELALLLLPKPVRDYVYSDIIAKNRYSVFGKRDECRFVEPGEEHRFLD
ncbi:unnamed protein product [Chondrus crispus]|uniref:Thiol-disulfide oxidoreductase DCC n=1 Tax=Chondrus crispus TaxID=2769 RepID=R7QHU2_CHOCR|nr:unnamed protein product [Chondrus crispus]CDF36970.1 unnamed protein product [Chondrus crispus]|eukprot:XP_005716789.1 unnamed protein product [Chondrus crispus]